MRASCTIVRPGETVTDESGDVATWVTTVSQGKCYARYPGLAWEQDYELVGATVVRSKLVVRVPFGVAYRPGDLVRIDADPDNPQLDGVIFRVASIDDMSQATAQRLVCDDYQAGVEIIWPEGDES